jgi:long-chain acyl-CoA synthetase
MTSPVIRCGERIRSHDEVRDRAGRIAAGLAGLGVRAGDRVAVVLRNEIEFVETSVGIGQLGAVPVPVNWHWKGSELGYLLDDCDAKAAFVHSDLVPVVRDATDRPVPIIEVRLSDALCEAYRLTGDSDGAAADFELEELVAAHPAPATAAGGSPLSVIYSSGTTGQPKGVLRQPMGDEQRTAAVERIFIAFGLRPGMSTLVPAPMYHSAPNAHALFAVAGGCDLTIMPKFTPRAFLETVQRRSIQHTQVVPTMFVRMLQLPDDERLGYDVSSLVSAVHAAAPCPPEAKRRMIDWWGPIILEYYGGTESGCVVSCTSQEWLAHEGTVGRALPGCDVKIVLEDGSEAPAGTSGEIYLNPGDAWPDFTYIGNDEKRRSIDRGGFITLGDGGLLDEDGFLYLTDRISDMVISGGVNIYPVEIEKFLITVPGIRDVAVFGIPDPDLGEILAAHVDTDPESGLTEDDIRDRVRENLAGYKVPRHVVIDRDLPREESGKLFKRKIRARYWN